MGFFDGVNSQTVSEAQDGFKEFKIGDNHAQITKVEEKISKESGKAMLEITFTDEEGATIRYYIVADDYKLAKLKQLSAAFKIPMEEINIPGKWVGKWGIVVCKAGEPYNGKVYNKVHYLRPDFEEQPPKQNEPPKENFNEPSPNNFVDDIPF
jgi:hypothetical protein